MPLSTPVAVSVSQSCGACLAAPGSREPSREGVSAVPASIPRAVTAWDIGEEAAAGKPPLRPFGSLAAHDDALRQVNRWFADEWQKLLAEKRAREREIERKFWNGEYRP